MQDSRVFAKMGRMDRTVPTGRLATSGPPIWEARTSPLLLYKLLVDGLYQQSLVLIFDGRPCRQGGLRAFGYTNPYGFAGPPRETHAQPIPSSALPPPIGLSILWAALNCRAAIVGPIGNAFPPHPTIFCNLKNSGRPAFRNPSIGRRG